MLQVATPPMDNLSKVNRSNLSGVGRMVDPHCFVLITKNVLLDIFSIKRIPREMMYSVTKY